MAPGKRSHSEFESDNQFGVGATLARVNGTETTNEPETTSMKRARDDDHADGSDGGEWQVVDRHPSKKRKKLPKKDGNYPSISHSPNSRLQSYVKIHDLQNLALYLLADGTSPQWCAVRHSGEVRKAVVLMVPGLEADMFDGRLPLSTSSNGVATNGTSTDSSELAQRNDTTTSESTSPSHEPVKPRKPGPDDYYPVKLVSARIPEPLRPFADMFEHIWPVKSPGEDRSSRMHSPLAAMLTAPIPKTKEEKKSKGPQFPLEGKNWQNKRTPVTEFLVGVAELLEEGYVLHPALCDSAALLAAENERRITNKTSAVDGWIDIPEITNVKDGSIPESQIEQGSVTAGRNVLAMDCEMCITSPQGVLPQVLSLTRVSLIDWDGNTVLDELVKPADEITDYLTPYSGITPQMLENVTTRLADVQEKLKKILTPHTILVGHSLNSDLNALKITFPFIIDTALLFPHPRGPPLKSSLKFLAQKYLAREIQKGHGSSGHNSIEDARTCLDLVKQKCEKGKTWGTSEASGESIFKRINRQMRPKKAKIDLMGEDEARIGAVVDWGEPSRGYGSSAKVTIGCENDAEIVAGIQRALVGDDDNALVPRGGCDLIWARLRELEAYRGFWNRSKLIDSDNLRTTTTSSTAGATLSSVIEQTTRNIQAIYDALPPCTALIVYSGSGDPRDLSAMQDLQKKFKEEYRVKKWDQLSVKWTDIEEQKLRAACDKARMGCGFVTVK
ncbi:Hypothetical protein R9X50_00286600 [Acrodontium crateriforme]|uniref:Exonuclease domain-containing protein n=1 Tax=Acrodontium crateriforme TaxID=150365 RepID=A0AAQ3RBC3_9PEZI|nr:Hypothetical protein R9X50_00286600 [Acrodontium crateriforme]